MPQDNNPEIKKIPPVHLHTDSPSTLIYTQPDIGTSGHCTSSSTSSFASISSSLSSQLANPTDQPESSLSHHASSSSLSTSTSASASSLPTDSKLQSGASIDVNNLNMRENSKFTALASGGDLLYKPTFNLCSSPTSRGKILKYLQNALKQEQKEEKAEDKAESSDPILKILHKKYLGECWIERLIEEHLPIDESFVHVAMVDEHNQIEKEASLRQRELERESRLNTWEDIHTPKIEIPMEELFKPSGRLHPRRYMILGRAGIGKSTLCRWIAHLWNQGKLWPEERFDYIFWIPLRKINPQNFPPLPHGETLTLADIIQRICLDDEIKLTSADLEVIKTNKKVLYLLDGFDETSQLKEKDTTYLKNILDKIIKEATYLILTSRPYQINITHVDQTLEIIGFNEEDIKSYIDKVMPEPVKNAHLKAFIQSNSNIKGLCHIPVHLDLICSIWKEDDPAIRFDEPPLTLTSLYQKMVEYLWDGYFRRKGANPDDLHNDERLFKTNTMSVLGLIANKMMQDKQLLIKPEEIKKIIECHSSDKDLTLQDLHEVGLLKATGKGSLSTKNSYFIHLTFQEYLAAHHLCCSETPELTAFIIEHRYDFRFQIVFKFLAGLLFLNDESLRKEKILNFFKVLYQEPQDILSLHHLLLAAECLDECHDAESFYEMVNTHTGLLDNLLQWTTRAITDSPAYVIYIIQLFKNSAHLYANKQILSLLVDWNDKGQAIFWLAEIKKAHPTILSFLQKYFVNSYYKEEAVKALYEIGLSEEIVPLFKIGSEDKNNFVRFCCSLTLIKYQSTCEEKLFDNLLIPFEFPDSQFEENFDLVELINMLQKNIKNKTRAINAFLHTVAANIYSNYRKNNVNKKLRTAVLFLSQSEPETSISILLAKIKTQQQKNEYENHTILSELIDMLGEIPTSRTDEVRLSFLRELSKSPDKFIQISAIRSLFRMNQITSSLLDDFIACLDIQNFLFSEEIRKTIAILNHNFNEGIFDIIFDKLANELQKPETIENTNYIPEVIHGLSEALKSHEKFFKKIVALLKNGNKVEQIIAIHILVRVAPRESVGFLIDKLNSVDPDIKVLVITELILSGETTIFLFDQLIDQFRMRNKNLAKQIAFWFLNLLDPLVLKALLHVLQKIPAENTSILLSEKKTTLDFTVLIELIKILTWSNYQSDLIRDFLNIHEFDLSPWLPKIEFQLINETFHDVPSEEKESITDKEDSFPSKEKNAEEESKTEEDSFLYEEKSLIKKRSSFLSEDWRCVLQGAPLKNLIQLYFELPEKGEELKLTLLLDCIYWKILNNRVIITLENDILAVYDNTDPLRIILNSKWKIARANNLKILNLLKRYDDQIRLNILTSLAEGLPEEKEGNNNDALFNAIRKGDLSIVRWLLQNGASITERNKYGHTALLWAAYQGKLKIVQWLLQNGASLTERDNEGNTALHWAACQGELEIVQWLLQNGASLTERAHQGNTALHWAACQGRLELVQWLLQNGASITEQDNQGNTALRVAARQGHLEIVRCLISQGALLKDRNMSGQTAYEQAKNNQHLDVVAFLEEVQDIPVIISHPESENAPLPQTDPHLPLVFQPQPDFNFSLRLPNSSSNAKTEEPLSENESAEPFLTPHYSESKEIRQFTSQPQDDLRSPLTAPGNLSLFSNDTKLTIAASETKSPPISKKTKKCPSIRIKSCNLL